jgi:type IV secretory pathway protease TraF
MIGAKSTTRYVWNASASVPVGLYRLRPAGELAVAELVAVQPPEPLAIEMDVARERDGRGRPLPGWQGCLVVAVGEVFLTNWQSAESLDGRYFGVLPTTAIVGRAEPLWTYEED